MLVLEKDVFIWKTELEKGREEGKEREPPQSSGSLCKSAITRTGSGWSQKPWTSLGLLSGSSSTAFPGALAGSRIRSGVARIQMDTASVTGGSSTCYTIMPTRENIFSNSCMPVFSLFNNLSDKSDIKQTCGILIKKFYFRILHQNQFLKTSLCLPFIVNPYQQFPL